MSITDWQDVMPHTVTIALVTARDDYGKPTSFAAAVSFQARVSYKSQKVASRTTGADVLASGSVHLMGIINTLTFDSKLTLPNGDQPILANWETISDENGDHHTKIYFFG